jgi:RNA polymerase sigma factor (sigma-70 family)
MLEHDQLIWQTFIGGDKSSFQQLMQKHYKQLFNYGTKLSPDAELVKDSIQDLFLYLWNKRENISNKVNVKAYLFSSLRRLLHRKIGVQERQKKSNIFNRATDAFTFQVSVEQQFIADESTAKLAGEIAIALQKLPGRQKEIVYLKFFHNFSRDEIAQAMNISPQTVSNLLQIAIKKLRTGLTNQFNHDLLFFIFPLIIKETIL